MHGARWPAAELDSERAAEVVRCPHRSCDGCSWIGRPYAEQLATKAEAVARALAPYPELAAAERSAPIAAPRLTRYRQRVKLVVREEGGAVRFGLYRGGTRELVPLQDCPVTPEPLVAIARKVVAVLGRARAAAPRGPVAGIDLRLGSGPAPVALVLVVDRHKPRTDDLPIDALAAACPELHTIGVNPNPGSSPYALGPRTWTVHGAERTEVHLGERIFHLSPGVFFQANLDQTAAIHRELRAFFAGDPGGRELVDLHCGVGTHGLALADLFAEVRGVDSSEVAVADAVEAARLAGLSHLRFSAGDAAGEAPSLLAGGVSAAIVNPPRAGCQPELRDALAEDPPARLAYVSCNPVTLARDLWYLVRRGFTCRRVVPVDMMPLTDHVECVALLDRDPLSSDRGRHPRHQAAGDERCVFLGSFGPPSVGPAEAPEVRWEREGPAALQPALRRDLSGVVRVPPPESAPDARHGATALLVGRMPGRGRLPAALLTKAGAREGATVAFRTIGRVDTHSVVTLRFEGIGLDALRRALRYFRHPVVGDTRHGLKPVNRYFGEKYGLDRAFLHLTELLLPDRPPIRWPLVPDLQAVLDRAP